MKDVVWLSFSGHEMLIYFQGNGIPMSRLPRIRCVSAEKPHSGYNWQVGNENLPSQIKAIPKKPKYSRQL